MISKFEDLPYKINIYSDAASMKYGPNLEIMAWLKKNTLGQSLDWRWFFVSRRPDLYRYRYHFKDPNIAMRFKLTFG
jgi:hypothetical protein